MRDCYDANFDNRLVELGIITREQLYRATSIANETGEDPDDVLLRFGYISPRRHIESLTAYLGIPYTELAPDKIDPEVVKLVPFDMAREYRVVPVSIDDDLTLDICRPLNPDALEKLAFTSGCWIHPILCDEDDVMDAIRRYYSEATGEDLGSVDDDIEYLDKDVEEKAEEVEVDESQVVRLIDSLLAQGIRNRASDIHIEPTYDTLRVRFRVDGVLTDAQEFPSDLHEPLVSRVKILSTLDITERRRPQDGAIFLRYRDRDIDLRVATSPTIYGESISFRILDQSKSEVKLHELGFSEADLEKTIRSLGEPFGFILSTGPTGCGKTTTMYALLNRIDRGSKKIITIEDPVEYRLDSINQIPINRRIGLGFADLLRSILRQDPNVIMVGEIRDPETARVAVQAALTGHLMLSTLHTNDAPEVLLRLMDIGIEYYYVREVVNLIIAQRLSRKLCPDCKEPYRASPDELRLMELPIDRETRIYRGIGCANCRNTGYLGRTGMFEVMKVTEEIREIMTPTVRLQSLTELAMRQGMRTMWQNAVDKVLAGETSLDEIKRTVPLQ